MRQRILIVDDDLDMCDVLEHWLSGHGFEAAASRSADEALELLARSDFDVVLTDINMDGMNGIELCERIVSNRQDVPVVVITAFGSLDTAVAAIRAGAYDFITKPVEMAALKITIERALQHRALREEVKRLRVEVERTAGFEEILGSSPPMQRVFDLVSRVSETDTSILITGESGTGKELLARAVHRRSRRRGRSFVAINCAAMPEALLESELFGHTRGAFTDAKTSRAGLFVQAEGGTVFLDEIGELALGLQPKLLRALQERVVRPVGSDTEVPFDARIVASTNRDIEAAVEEHRFREDLYYRINVVQLAMPPLRSRGNDILLVAQHFLAEFAAQFGKEISGITAAAAERLLSYAWPGNVRELRNCIERAVALARHREILVEDLPERIQSYHRAQVLLTAHGPTELVPLEEVERRYILHALETLGGNKTMAAKVLGLDRKTLYRKLQSYERSAETGSR